jgi:dienelactone hydrolase
MNNKEGGFTFDRWGILGHGAGAITSVALAAELDQVTAVCLLQPTGALDDKELCLKMKASEAASLVVIAREDELCQISDCHLFAQLGSGQARRLYCNIPGLGHGDACGARDDESMTKRAKKAHASQLSIVTEFFLAELTNDTRADEYLVARRGNWKVGHPAALKP